MEAPIIMLHIGLDLSRKRLDFDLLCEDGSRLERGAVPPNADGLRGLARRVGVFGEPVCAAIESMNGARPRGREAVRARHGDAHLLSRQAASSAAEPQSRTLRFSSSSPAPQTTLSQRRNIFQTP